MQFGLGDLEVPNPTESALVRAAGLQPATWLLRTDLAAAIDPSLLGLTQPGAPFPVYPHRFLSNPMLFDPLSPPLVTAIGVAAQKQIADFFASGTISDPNQYLSGSFAGYTCSRIPPPCRTALTSYRYFHRVSMKQYVQGSSPSLSGS